MGIVTVLPGSKPCLHVPVSGVFSFVVLVDNKPQQTKFKRPVQNTLHRFFVVELSPSRQNKASEKRTGGISVFYFRRVRSSRLPENKKQNQGNLAQMVTPLEEVEINSAILLFSLFSFLPERTAATLLAMVSELLKK